MTVTAMRVKVDDNLKHEIMMEVARRIQESGEMITIQDVIYDTLSEKFLSKKNSEKENANDKNMPFRTAKRKSQNRDGQSNSGDNQ